MTTLSDADLEKLKALARAATAGEWIECVHGEVACRNSDGEIMRIIDCGELGEYNAAHIAAFSPPTAIALCEEIQRLRDELADAERTIKAIEKEYDERYCQP